MKYIDTEVVYPTMHGKNKKKLGTDPILKWESESAVNIKQVINIAIYR